MSVTFLPPMPIEEAQRIAAEFGLGLEEPVFAEERTANQQFVVRKDGERIGYVTAPGNGLGFTEESLRGEIDKILNPDGSNLA